MAMQRTVVITGGSRGLGRAFARALVEKGANVVITGRDGATLNRTAGELGSVVAMVADSTDPEDMARVVGEAEARFGGLDVLVNNAGLRGPIGPTWEVDHNRWWEAVAVNLGGTTIATRAALEVMVPRGRGRIINIVSQAGWHRWPHVSAYSVSKAAVIKLTENLALELRRSGVTTLAYHPGLLDVGLTAEGAAAAVDGGVWEQRIAAWVDNEREAGRITPVKRATDMLLRLIEHDDPTLSGRYVTVDDHLT